MSVRTFPKGSLFSPKGRHVFPAQPEGMGRHTLLHGVSILRGKLDFPC